MTGKEYPEGTFDFKAMVTGDHYFVDKTMMIADVCKAVNKTFLYTRPRRFGKSTNLSMLNYYFNMKYKDEEDIFKGLYIETCDKCEEFKNAYPVIWMNFGDLASSSSEMFEYSLSNMIASVARDANIILEGHNVRPEDKAIISRAYASQLNPIEVRKFIRTLCAIYRDVFGKKTIILVDEYDHCIQNIHSRTKFDEIIQLLGPFMEQSFKFNEDIQFGVVTGIMPLAKTSMLSSFNNASVCSILDKQGDEFFGFTEEEVIRLLKETGNPPEKISEIREWYDGYRFGDKEVYNPYSVIMYLKKGCVPKAYWVNMTGGGLSEDLIASMGRETLQNLKEISEGKRTIESPIDTAIAYPDILRPGADPSLIYSYLAMSGYLKTVDTMEQVGGKSLCTVSMVNKEVSYTFDTIVKRATDLDTYVQRAVDAIYDVDPDVLKDNLESMLSGLAMDEDWVKAANDTELHNKYRDVFMAYLMDPLHTAKEEQPFGIGRTDICFPGSGGSRPIIIEVKSTRKEGTDLHALAKEGLKQIESKGYSKQQGMRDAIRVGIGVWMKTVEVAIEK